ncbi:MAG: GNAT family protein [Methanomassiliicoccales archaeon]|jgi:ribosomal-protein-alanine N-acetyltransferase
MTLDERSSDMPVLITDRLLIRPVQLTDADAMFELKSDPLVTDQYGQLPHHEIGETRRWIGTGISDREERKSFIWAITMRADGDVIGECCFWNFDRDRKCAEVGYELRRDHWRQGLMMEALKALLYHGFEDLGLHRIEANPLAFNEASKNLLLRLGFKLEGTLRERVLFNGRFVDQMYYGLLRDDRAERKDGP